MADEAPTSDTPPQNVEKAPLASVEATMESNVQGGTESSTITSGVVDDEKSLEFAEKLIERGSKAAKEQDYAEATDCFSRALEIRVAHYGELSPECAYAYYKYGCALLYKAQDEADPLGAVPKKEDEAQKTSSSDKSVNKAIEGESSTVSSSTNGKQALVAKGQEEEEDESEDEDLAEADEDESDLDLAWKMLDVARFIVEKHSGDTMEKVNILSALAEAALEREDIETSLSDYLKALDILERLVEPDSRHLAEINFRICLCLEIGSKAEEAIPYCQKAISICKSRIHRLSNEGQKSSEGSQSSEPPKTDDTEEIDTLTALSAELEKKLEDLEQFASNPTSIMSDILGMVAAKAKAIEKKNSSSSVMSSSQQLAGVASGSGDFSSSSVVSTAHTSGTTTTTGVTNLGVVGRGVKRVVMSTVTEESTNLVKRPALDPNNGNGNGNGNAQ